MLVPKGVSKDVGNSEENLWGAYGEESENRFGFQRERERAKEREKRRERETEKEKERARKRKGEREKDRKDESGILGPETGYHTDTSSGADHPIHHPVRVELQTQHLPQPCICSSRNSSSSS